MVGVSWSLTLTPKSTTIESHYSHWVQSTVVSSDIWYLGSKPNPSIPRIGPSLRSILPDIGPRYQISRYWIPRIWSGNFWQWHSEVHDPPCPLRAIHPPCSRASLPPIPWARSPRPLLGEMYLGFRGYHGSKLLAAACPRYPRLICIYRQALPTHWFCTTVYPLPLVTLLMGSNLDAQVSETWIDPDSDNERWHISYGWWGHPS